MNIGKPISAAPNVLLVLFGIAAIFFWSQYSTLKWEIEGLALREIELRIENKDGKRLKEVSIGIEPMHSFDEIMPRHKLTILGEGNARLSVAFVRHFKIQVGASGYKTRTIEYNDSDPSELLITLEPVEAELEKITNT